MDFVFKTFKTVFLSLTLFAASKSVAVTAPNGNFLSIVTSPKSEFACGVLRTGKVQCFGNGSSLQEVPDDVDNVKELALSETHVCALRHTGTVRCWGAGPRTAKVVQEASKIRDAVTIASGEDFSCVLDKENKAKCWGRGWNDEALQPIPASAAESNVQLSISRTDACVLKENGSVVCWGVAFPRSEFAFDSSMQDLQAISLSPAGLCGLKHDGDVYCSFRKDTPPVKYFSDAVQVSSGTNLLNTPFGDSAGTVCATFKNGKSACSFISAQREIELPLSFMNATEQISVGENLLCHLNQDGLVMCWGKFEKTYIDDQSFSEKPRLLGKNQVNHRCAINKYQHLFCWGENQFGQATPPSDLRNVKELSLGKYHSCALNSQGQVFCWGDDSEGQSTPPQDLKDVIHITAFSKSTCAFNKDGEMTCWGDKYNQDAGHLSRILRVRKFLRAVQTKTTLQCNGLFTVRASHFGARDYSAEYDCTNNGSVKNITLKYTYNPNSDYPVHLTWDSPLKIGLTRAVAVELFKTSINIDVCRNSYSSRSDYTCYLGSDFGRGYVDILSSGQVVSVLFP